MGFGGSILSMIASLKNNERPKRIPLSSWDRGKSIPKNPKKLEYKVVKEDELNFLKTKIRIKTKYERKKRIILLSSLVCLIIILSITISKLCLSDAIKQRIYVSNKYYNAIRDSINQRNDSLYFGYLNEGFVCLNQENYSKAKEILYEAYQIKPSEFEGIYLYTKACILECKNENIYCQSAERSLTFLKYKYPEKEEVQLLIEIYNK